MAAFDTIRPVSDGVLFGGRNANFFTKPFATVIAWYDARATRKALSKLTDRELDDIGLSRVELDSLVR